MYYFLSDFFFEKKASSLGTRGVRIDRENLLMLTKLYSKMVCVHCSCPYRLLSRLLKNLNSSLLLKTHDLACLMMTHAT